MKVKIFNRNLWKNYLSVLGTIGILTSFATIFITIDNNHKFIAGIVFLLLLLLVYIVMLFRANRLDSISLNINGLKVDIFYGDLFNSEDLKLIPFNEYFDTLVDNVVIAENSLNGLFINNHFNQSTQCLDGQVVNKLNGKAFKINEGRQLGKKKNMN